MSYFEIYCEELAKDLAKRRVPPEQIPQKLSRNTTLMKLLGLKKTSRGVKISRKGMLKKLGRVKCDEIMDKFLEQTGVYQKTENGLQFTEEKVDVEKEDPRSPHPRSREDCQGSAHCSGENAITARGDVGSDLVACRRGDELREPPI